MSKREVVDICHLCGCVGKLSFEHIPPRKAFNNRPLIHVEFEKAISLGPDVEPKGDIYQRGSGGYTLCENCNNSTGSWYAKHFIDWCYQGMDILNKTKGKPTLIYLHYLFPLSILKQIIVMFFSINADTFQKVNSELVRFVLNRNSKYLSPRYRFYVYYNTSRIHRCLGVTARLNIGMGKNIDLISEFAFPPFGYVMTIDTKVKPDNRLFEITHFSGYSYNQRKVMTVKLPLLPVNTVFPADYRTQKEINEQVKKSKDAMKNII